MSVDNYLLVVSVEVVVSVLVGTDIENGEIRYVEGPKRWQYHDSQIAEQYSKQSEQGW
jgi:hypothetical protein